MNGDTALDIAEALEAIMKGAGIQHTGDFFHDEEMTNKGLDMIAAAIGVIDAKSPTGRDVLLPLLDHRDANVRVTAASGLWQSHHERAVAVLKEIEETCETEAGLTAAMVLVTKGKLSSCGPDPRFEASFPLKR